MGFALMRADGMVIGLIEQPAASTTDHMIKRIIGLPNCMKGRHVRSEKHITQDGETYVSRCAHCGVRLRRRAKRDWIVDRA